MRLNLKADFADLLMLGGALLFAVCAVPILSVIALSTLYGWGVIEVFLVNFGRMEYASVWEWFFCAGSLCFFVRWAFLD